MGYYRGDYYRGDYYSRFRGDPGLFGSIGRFVGGALSTVGKVASIIPGAGGLVGTVANVAGGLLSRASGGGAQPVAVMPGGAMPVIQAQPTPQGVTVGHPVKKRGVTVGVSPLGTVGVRFAKTRRMNAGNAKAARRAIRRIKSVRHLLQSIERELPHRKAVAGGRALALVAGRRR